MMSLHKGITFLKKKQVCIPAGCVHPLDGVRPLEGVPPGGASGGVAGGCIQRGSIQRGASWSPPPPVNRMTNL